MSFINPRKDQKMNKIIVGTTIVAFAMSAKCAICSKCEPDVNSQPKFCSCCGERLSAEKELDASYELLAHRYSVKLWEAMGNCTNIPSVPVVKNRAAGIAAIQSFFLPTFYSADSSKKKTAYEMLRRTFSNRKDFEDSVLAVRATTMSTLGRNIYISILKGNLERECAGLKCLWPCSEGGTSDDKDDISGKVFQTSTAYFNELIDVKNENQKAWSPYVTGIANNEVLQHGKSRWIVAKGVCDSLDDAVPVLVSANVDVSSLIVGEGTHDTTGMKDCLKFSGDFAIVVRKGGEALIVKRDQDSLSQVYKQQKFSLPKGFAYLVP